MKIEDSDCLQNTAADTNATGQTVTLNGIKSATPLDQNENGITPHKNNHVSELDGWRNGYTPNGNENGTIRQRPTKQTIVTNGTGSQNGIASSDTSANILPTLSEIKAALPKHCFKATVGQSMYYVAKDLLIIAALFLIGQCILGCKSLILQVCLTPLVWFAQGTLFFAVFVLGHDCNHGSFSSYALLNDCLGTVFHSMVMTPYYPWKLSHRHHHNNTGNMDQDEIFYPIRQKHDNRRHFLPLFGLGFGWIAYLWKGFGPRPMNHWIPSHPLFSKHMFGCTLSVASVGVWVLCLYYYAVVMGVISLFYHYVVPVFICGCYIVVVTFLHHSDIDLPWYSDENWENVKGKLSSVDREYGFIHDVIHTIGTHQVHHLFPIIPHYHLREATVHFRKFFPKFVHINETGIVSSFWKMFFKYTSQGVVANDAIIHRYVETN